MISPDVLFWDISISDTKLMENFVWSEYTYEVRFTKSKVKIKVIYNGNEKVYELKPYWGTGTILSIINDVNDWVDDIEYGLNDCDCDDK
jgi:hypothetical protein